MSKIIQAVNAMISKSDKISKCIENDGEYFFLYNEKYRWSIVRYGDDSYSLFYYSCEESIEQLSLLGERARLEGVDFVQYSTRDLKFRESYESFQDLYLTITEKLHGVDIMLDDIIDDL